MALTRKTGQFRNTSDSALPDQANMVRLSIS
jgi:hypothetical protein